LDAVMQAGRENGTATVLFHSAVAEKLGLDATASKTLDVLIRLGPQSAGQIADHTGLATASVTALIDRLERRGFVRRARDPADRRKVIVEPVAEKVAASAHHFMRFGGAMEALVGSYSDEELAVILDFLRRSAECLREWTGQLRAEEKEP
jgi:DNA-binding MarR family transcriptional regulator